VLPDKPEVVIAKLHEGICPYCDQGPYKLVGTHIYRSHGITINDLKDALYIPRNTGFCSNELKDTKVAHTRKQGFGIKVKPKEHPTKGRKLDVETVEKIKRDRARPEVKERFKKAVSTPEARRKNVDARRNPSADVKESQTNRIINAHKAYIQKIGNDEYRKRCKENNKRAREKRYGSEFGRLDIVYAILAKQFIEEVQKDSSRGVVKRLSETIGEKFENVQNRLKIAVKRGLLVETGRPMFPNGVLTEKALRILSESEETQ
jgi:hypothetical protein